MQDTEEIWKDVVGYEDYQISSIGRIKIKERLIITNNRDPYPARSRIKKLFRNQKYIKVTFTVKNSKKTVSIHRLVATHFIPNPENLPQVNHKDLNKHNNSVENLEWCTYNDNINHAIINGKIKNKKITAF